MGGTFNSSSDLAGLRAAYSQAIADKDFARMSACAQRLLGTNPSLSIAQQIVNTLPAGLPGRPPVARRVAILRSFTIETSIPFLAALARLHGIELTIRVGEFNSYAQEIIDPNSWLYEFDPQIVILAALTRDLAPHLWEGRLASTAAAPEVQVQECVSKFTTLLDLLRSRCTADVVIQNLELPIDVGAGILDARQSIGQAEILRSINRALNLEALHYEGVYILDYDALVSRHGRKHWTDEKRWLANRAPIASGGLVHFAREYLKFIVPLSGRQAKVLVVDLDNTLWGGVVGEDGIGGIKIGPEYPGAAYLALQKAILDIADRGVLLAICSKNNENEAMEVLDNHREMLLRPQHFAAIRINWNDKVQNLRQIAEELNVGLDSIAFLDDNPAERQRVKLAAPEITVIDLPEDPGGYIDALRGCPAFERLTLTSEDKVRGKYYSEQRQRRQLEATAGSMEEFYWSLGMRAEFVEVNSGNLARIAQLTQKTNQLNLTTRRYTESQIVDMCQDPAWRISGVRLIDNFGDNGIVGTIFMKIAAETAEIDTLLLSCRVIGRTVETAILARACDTAAMSGCKRLTGWFLPSNKNAPAADIYSEHGFIMTAQEGEGTFWELDLSNKSISMPAWISPSSGRIDV